MSVPTHFPSNEEITYPACLGCPGVSIRWGVSIANGFEFLLWMKGAVCWWDLERVRGEPERTGFVQSQEEEAKGDLMVFFTCVTCAVEEGSQISGGAQWKEEGDRHKLLPRKFQLDVRKNFVSPREWPQTGTGVRDGQGLSVLGDVQNSAGHSPKQPELSSRLELTSKSDLP